MNAAKNLYEAERPFISNAIIKLSAAKDILDKEWNICAHKISADALRISISCIMRQTQILTCLLSSRDNDVQSFTKDKE